MIRRTLVVALASLGLALGFSSPAMASTGWFTAQNGCSVDASHGMSAQLQYYNYSYDSQYFGRLIVNAPGATSIRASLRNAAGTVVQGPWVGYQNFDFVIGTTVPKSWDYRVRVFYYYGPGCNLRLNPQS